MRVVKKNVYYCDFCKKKSLRKLTEHEKHCTGNPNRQCRLCKNKISIPELIKNYPVNQEEYANTPTNYITIDTFKQIRDDAEQCPMCILTILRALNAFVIVAKQEQKEEYLSITGMFNPEKYLHQYHYDFKKDLANYWQEKNDNARESEEQSTYF